MYVCGCGLASLANSLGGLNNDWYTLLTQYGCKPPNASSKPIDFRRQNDSFRHILCHTHSRTHTHTHMALHTRDRTPAISSQAAEGKSTEQFAVAIAGQQKDNFRLASRFLMRTRRNYLSSNATNSHNVTQTFIHISVISF